MRRNTSSHISLTLIISSISGTSPTSLLLPLPLPLLTVVSTSDDDIAGCCAGCWCCEWCVCSWLYPVVFGWTDGWNWWQKQNVENDARARENTTNQRANKKIGCDDVDELKNYACNYSIHSPVPKVWMGGEKNKTQACATQNRIFKFDVTVLVRSGERFGERFGELQRLSDTAANRISSAHRRRTRSTQCTDTNVRINEHARIKTNTRNTRNRHARELEEIPSKTDPGMISSVCPAGCRLRGIKKWLDLSAECIGISAFSARRWSSLIRPWNSLGSSEKNAHKVTHNICVYEFTHTHAHEYCWRSLFVDHMLHIHIGRTLNGRAGCVGDANYASSRDDNWAPKHFPTPTQHIQTHTKRGTRITPTHGYPKIAHTLAVGRSEKTESEIWNELHVQCYRFGILKCLFQNTKCSSNNSSRNKCGLNNGNIFTFHSKI